MTHFFFSFHEDLTFIFQEVLVFKEIKIEIKCTCDSYEEMAVSKMEQNNQSYQ